MSVSIRSMGVFSKGIGLRILLSYIPPSIIAWSFFYLYISGMIGSVNSGVSTYILFGLSAIAIGCGIVLWLFMTIVPPLHNISEVIRAMKLGDDNVDIPYLDNADEIGEIAHSIAILRRTMTEKSQIERQHSEQKIAMISAELELAKIKRAHAELLIQVAEAQRMRSLATLAGGVAHEINTPLQFIGDNVSFIKSWIPRLLYVVEAARTSLETGDWREVGERAKAIKFDFAARELPAAAELALDGIAKISSIVQAIKEFSFPSGKTAQPFNLNRAIETTCIVTRNQWKHVAELDLRLDPGLPPLTGIEGEINQVLVNLIMNAAQAIEEKGGGNMGRIVVTTHGHENSVVVSVSDTGCGISQENIDHLFELFFTTKAPGKGTGQGLAITKSIVLRHGGTITVESTPGEGSRFQVVLPVAGAAAAQEDCS